MTFQDEHRRKFPRRVEDLPDEEFYAILYPESTTVPGDERSRTNPGHGYPEHTVENWRMEVYPTREEWEAEILKESSSEFGRRKFKAIRAIPASINVTVKVE